MRDVLEIIGLLLALPFVILLLILARPLIMMAMVVAAILYCSNYRFRHWIETAGS